MVIRDQIHGDIAFSEAEKRIIQSRSFERLRYIRQLGFVEGIYPGASHNRYQHSLGVCQCVTDMYNAVCANNPGFYRDGDLELLRMMALVHDLGHSPYSHASEVLSDVTHEERLADILQYEKKNIILAHEYDCEPWELVYQVYIGSGSVYMRDPHLIALHGFLDGFIDADKVDYLERDAVNCGVGYGRFDRGSLIRSLTTIRDKKGMEMLAIRSDGVQAFESFVLARYYMFSQVYLHPKERIARFQFCQEMKELLHGGKYPDEVTKFLKLDDTVYSRRLKFLERNDWELVLDVEYDEKVRNLVDKRFNRMVMCDVPYKPIFRKDADDATVYVVDTIYGTTKPCSEVSPVLRGIEFASVHRLRYYADVSIANEVKAELRKILK